MATEMKIWRVSDKKKLEIVQDVPFEANHMEQDLESWIEGCPSILGDDLLVVNRQLNIPGVGTLDLLCIDSAGVPVIVELKRKSTPREAVAQALDYASWMDTLSQEQFKEFAEEYLKKPLAEAFSDQFPGELPEEIDCQRHRIILVAPKLDAAAERIINYLSERYSMGINAVFFKYAKLGSEEILVRSMLVSEEVSEARRASAPRKPKPEDLNKIAAKRNVTELVTICRQMSSVWDERPSFKHGGSWAYALTTDQGWRLMLRIDVFGGDMKTPDSELDLWLRYKSVAEATAADEAVVRNAIQVGYSLLAERSGNLIIRLRTLAEAEKLVQQLKEWASSPKPQDAAV